MTSKESLMFEATGRRPPWPSTVTPAEWEGRRAVTTG